nr:hypothetical protein CFP56_14810 [Quercus suber]
MHHDLYKGLGLAPKDLSDYDTLLIGFDRKMVIPKGMIKFLVQTRSGNYGRNSRGAGAKPLVQEYGKDLLAEFTEGEERGRAEEALHQEFIIFSIAIPLPNSWKLYVDGASNQRGSRVGVVMISPKKLIVDKSLRLGFLGTNNEAEYKAPLAGLDAVRRLGCKSVDVFYNSRLVTSQV